MKEGPEVLRAGPVLVLEAVLAPVYAYQRATIGSSEMALKALRGPLGDPMTSKGGARALVALPLDTLLRQSTI